jgi:hypothetical protein
MDAPPDHDPLPQLTEEMERMAERLRSQPDWKEPTESQKAEAVRGFDEALERMRAQRQGLRDFTAKVERQRAERGRTENPTPDRP